MVPSGASLAQTYMSMAYGSISPVSALYSLSVLRSPMSSRFASPWKQMTRRAGESSGERLENPPAPLDHRMAPWIDVDAPVEPRGRAVCARLEHHPGVAFDEAILGARSEGRNDEGAPVAGRRLTHAAGGKPRRFDERAALARELGDDRGRGEQVVGRGAGAAGEHNAAREPRRIAEKFFWEGHFSGLGRKCTIGTRKLGICKADRNRRI